LRATAQKIDQNKLAERQRAGVRMRLGFQVVLLALVVLLAFILVFPTARLYSAQQEQIARLRVAVEVAKVRTEDLQADVDRWDDPAFIKTKARQMSYILPGEKAFRVIDPQNAPALPSVTPPPPSPDPGALVAEGDSEAKAPWYWDLWESTLQAGRL